MCIRDSCYSILRTRLEKFETKGSSTLLETTPLSYGFAQTLPLRRRFSCFPAFALIGGPVLAILIPMFALVDTRRAVGLPVRPLKSGVSDDDSAPIVISVIHGRANDPSDVYVNSKQIPWSELCSTLQTQLKLRPRWIVYVEGEDGVLWAHVANAIDVAQGLHADVLLLTSAPRIDSGHQSGKKNRSSPQRK